MTLCFSLERDLLEEFHSYLPDESHLFSLPVTVSKMPDPSTLPITQEKKSDTAIDDAPRMGEKETTFQILQKETGLQFDSKKDKDLCFETLGLDSATEFQHSVVAVGGTFDHLHDGHRILLTVAGYLAEEALIVGITGSELLINKEYATVIECYMTRQLLLEEFLEYVFPMLQVETYMIHDTWGPAATLQDIDALVLSKETIHDGIEVNKERIAKGFDPLTVYDVGLVGCINGNAKNHYCDKLSSTEIRRLEFENLNMCE